MLFCCSTEKIASKIWSLPLPLQAGHCAVCLAIWYHLANLQRTYAYLLLKVHSINIVSPVTDYILMIFGLHA